MISLSCTSTPTVDLVIKTGPAHPPFPRLPLECRPHGETNLILRNFAARFATRQNFSARFATREFEKEDRWMEAGAGCVYYQATMGTH